ncbi:HD-GYP domain-containing protein [Gayadomonas joobiniege]|uniref:HD-GYP domain-containing protein n=1 Tax=Gayadomonas joobiniege TaxID=1234606 RepID=UPI00036C92CC|nr:HD domain-containing phosphohydrolase [Gayadomonas joobiniege]
MFNATHNLPPDHQPTQPQASSVLDQVLNLANLIKSKDLYTYQHQLSVAQHAAAIADVLKLPNDDIFNIWCGALLHDLGKLNVPNTLLNKRTKLTDEEFYTVKQHANHGRVIAHMLRLPEVITDIISQHHERLDGSGYPYALIGEQISLPVRIVCVADVYQAISHRRPYRSALGDEFALAELEKGADQLFDAKVIWGLKQALAKKAFITQFSIKYIKKLAE